MVVHSSSDYEDTIDFLQRNWSLSEVRNFINETEEVINILKKENITFKSTNYKDTFQVPITKQITLYYRIDSNKDIELLRFFNNYQNPTKIGI